MPPRWIDKGCCCSSKPFPFKSRLRSRTSFLFLLLLISLQISWHMTSSYSHVRSVYHEQQQQQQQRQDSHRSSSSSMELSLPACLISLAIGIPTFCTILPLTVIYQVSKNLPKQLGFKKEEEEDGKFVNLEEDYDTEDALEDCINWSQRKYDVVLLGATGFTGQIAVEYLAEQYKADGKILKWAIAGRNQKKMNDVKRNISEKLGISLDEIDTIVVDTSMRSTLPDLVRNTRVVASTAGPFYEYGSPVVEFCAKYGTSYTDITGEIDWCQSMIAKYHRVAEKSGAKIVSLCGHDSIPWDLSTKILADTLHEAGDKLSSVEFCDKAIGGVSGGTLATARLALSRINDMPRYSYDPFVMNLNGQKSPSKTKLMNPIFPEKFTSTGSTPFANNWTAPFVMAEVNGAVVKRSIALSDNQGKYSQSGVTYRESMASSNFLNAAVITTYLGILTVSLLNPLTSALMKRILPKQGEGPSAKTMENGYLLVCGVGKGEKGSVAESVVYVPKDAGYFFTARMLVESALSLSLDSEKLPIKTGGFFTPATAMGDVLIKRLSNIGIKFACEIRSKL